MGNPKKRVGGESEVNHLAVVDEIDKVSNFVQTLKLFLPIPTEIRIKRVL